MDLGLIILCGCKINKKNPTYFLKLFLYKRTKFTKKFKNKWKTLKTQDIWIWINKYYILSDEFCTLYLKFKLINGQTCSPFFEMSNISDLHHLLSRQICPRFFFFKFFVCFDKKISKNMPRN